MRGLGVADIAVVALPRLPVRTMGLRHLVLLVCVYAAVAAAQRPLTFALLTRDYLAIALPAAVCAVAFSLLVLILMRRHGSPRDILVAQRSRLGAGFIGILLFCVGLAAFSTYKLFIPFVVPFVWDLPFEHLDSLLHGGVAPWQFTHAVVPASFAELIGTLYGMPWFLYWFGTLGYAAFCAPEPLRSRHLWASALTLGLLGTVAATVFASHGPILFPQFGLAGYEGLAAALRDSAAGRDMLSTADYLYGAYATGEARFGSGISAMPSMHVAIVTLNLCLYASLSRWLAIPAGLFAALIVVGSVHFGWHYAIDAYASLIAVPVLWWIAGRLTRPMATARTAVA